MMNRVLGVLFTLLTFVLIAFAILNWGNYHSMLFGKETAEPEAVVDPLVTEGEEDILTDEEVVVEADSLGIDAAL